MKMKRLDRYITGYFLSSFCVALVFMIALYTMLDAVGRIDEFVSAARQLPEEYRDSVPGYVFRYYLLSAPYYFLQFAPFITLLAVMFTAVRLAQNNELVPIVSAGVSLFRVVAPLFIGALIVALSMVGIREFVVPRIDDVRDSLRDRLLNQRVDRTYNDILLVAGKDHVRCQRFSPAQAQIDEMSLISREPGQSTHVNAKVAKYKMGPEGMGWYLIAGRKTVRKGEQFLPPEDVTFLKGVSFTPEDLYVAYKGKEMAVELSFRQLNQLSLWAPERPDYITLLHYFLTFPLMNLILPLLGLPFVLRFERRGSSEGIGIAFLIFLVYFGIDFYMRGMGNQAILHPMVASWIPVVIFGSLGIILFDATKT